MIVSDGESPLTITVVEHLILLRLEAAERGEVDPSPRGWQQRRRASGGPPAQGAAARGDRDGGE